MPKTKMPKSKVDDESKKKPSRRVRKLAEEGRMAKHANERKLKNTSRGKAMYDERSYSPPDVLKTLLGQDKGDKETILESIRRKKG